MSDTKVVNFLPPELKSSMFGSINEALNDTLPNNSVGGLGNSYTGKIFTAENGNSGAVTVEFMALEDSSIGAYQDIPVRPIRDRRVLVESLEGPYVNERLEIVEITHPGLKPDGIFFKCEYFCDVNERSGDNSMPGAALGFILSLIDEDRAAAGFVPPVPDIVSTSVLYSAPTGPGEYDELVRYGGDPIDAKNRPSNSYSDFAMGDILPLDRAHYLASFIQQLVSQ